MHLPSNWPASGCAPDCHVRRCVETAYRGQSGSSDTIVGERSGRACISLPATLDHGIGVVSRRWVIEFGLTGGFRSKRSLSVGEVDGGQSRVLMPKAKSIPSPRDPASEEAPGVLPERAKPAARGPLPQTAWR